MVVTLTLQPTLALTDDQFAQICVSNRDLKFERTVQGGLVTISLTGERRANAMQRSMVSSGRGIARPSSAISMILRRDSDCPMVPFVHPMLPGWSSRAGMH